MKNFALSKVELLCLRSLTVMITIALLLASLSATTSAQRRGELVTRRGPTGRLPRQVATPAAPTAKRMPIKLERVSPSATCNDIIVDGGFETGGIPNANWDPETSTNFGTSLCDTSICSTNGGLTAPNGGTHWLWFGGGTGGAAEDSTLGQTVTITNGAVATLTFQMKIQQVTTPFTDAMRVRVDGNIIQTFTEPAVGEGVYTLRSIDLSAFADGAAHQILFDFTSIDGATNFLIDDVALNVCTSAPAPAGGLLITEFRVRGPSGANDEFIEIYNATGADHTVDSLSGTGYAVAASDGVTRCSIPNGTVIPNRGHYLCVNSVAYSLATYPAGSGTTATGDATYTTDIPDNAGIALFNNNTGGGSFTLANRIDAVGSTSEADTLYKEGTGYPALTPFSIDYSFYRDNCGKQGSIPTFGGCPSGGNVLDTNNNAVDFIFQDTNGTSAGAGQRLGAPGPENLSSPIERNAVIAAALLDPCVGGPSPPNRVRDFTSDPANNSTFGTLDIRRTITNNTGANVTRLRFRVVDITTFPAPSGIADLRPRTSTSVVVTVDRAPCGSGTSNVTVEGTTLEQPPSQPNGGGFNSSLSAGTVTLATPLATGGTVDVRFLLGIQQTGSFKFYINVEALP